MDAKKAAMERERDSLNQSDALSLKEQQTEISGRIRDQEQICREKETQLLTKEDQVTGIQARQKEENDRLYTKEQEIRDLVMKWAKRL